MRVALDTNLLVYAEGVNGPDKQEAALALITRLPRAAVVIPAQALGELFNVLVRKARRSRTDARQAMLAWRDAFQIAETSSDVMLAAADLATDHQFSIWDAVIFSAASTSGCRLLLSEDLQDGFTSRGVTVVNPLAGAQNDLLRALLDG